ncbi:MAG: nitroreductase family protein, partial [Pyrinomonadaceae bacterium]
MKNTKAQIINLTNAAMPLDQMILNLPETKSEATAQASLADEIIAQAEPILSVIARRRSVRHFAPEMPPRSLVLWAIEAATHAPSGMNKQPWRFVVVSNDETKAKMVKCVSEEIEEILEVLAGGKYTEKVGDYLRCYATTFCNAPVVINVLYREYGQVIASLMER